MLVACLVASILAVITSFLALMLALRTQIDVEAMKKSTHSIQYIDPLQDLTTSDVEKTAQNLHKKPKLEALTFDDDLFNDEADSMENITSFEN